MILDKHKLDGVEQIKSKTLSTEKFEFLIGASGYKKLGAAPAQGKRIKTW